MHLSTAFVYINNRYIKIYETCQGWPREERRSNEAMARPLVDHHRQEVVSCGALLVDSQSHIRVNTNIRCNILSFIIMMFSSSLYLFLYVS